jgi:hypothetical protein
MPPLRMPHHAARCSSFLNCQSNFRLKVFPLFSTPTAVFPFFHSFFCFSHASILPDFLNWLFACLLYACHIMQRLRHAFLSATIPRCFSIVSSTVFQPSAVFQHMYQHYVSTTVPALCFSISTITVFQLLRHCQPAMVRTSKCSTHNLCFNLCFSSLLCVLQVPLSILTI